MKKSTKGALAASAAAILLLGGAGSLAYWNASQDVGGVGIASGELKLSAPDCGTGWTLEGGDAFTGSSEIVPGDTLTKVCSFTVTASGDHLAADLAADTAAFASANDLTSELTVGATFEIAGDPIPAQITSANDGDVIVATVTVGFDGPGATNDSQALTATLDAITITAQQVHS
jgi:alternate signal-mediated exported protein